MVGREKKNQEWLSGFLPGRLRVNDGVNCYGKQWLRTVDDEMNFACLAFEMSLGPFRLRCPTNSQCEGSEQSHWVQMVLEADSVSPLNRGALEAAILLGVLSANLPGLRIDLCPFLWRSRWKSQWAAVFCFQSFLSQQLLAHQKRRSSRRRWQVASWTCWVMGPFQGKCASR